MENKDNNEMTDTYEFEETITLSLDDGKELPCVIVSIFPVEDKEYIALLPTEGEEYEEGEVFLYRFHETPEGEPVLDNIESDEEYDKVVDAFDEILDTMEYEDVAGEDEE